MPDEAEPLAVAFREKVATQTVLIERFYTLANGQNVEQTASGVIIGNDPRANTVLVGTAAHVLVDAPAQPIRWCISRIEQRLEGKDVRVIEVRVAEFFTDKPIADGENIY